MAGNETKGKMPGSKRWLGRVILFVTSVVITTVGVEGVLTDYGIDTSLSPDKGWTMVLSGIVIVGLYILALWSYSNEQTETAVQAVEAGEESRQRLEAAYLLICKVFSDASTLFTTKESMTGVEMGTMRRAMIQSAVTCMIRSGMSPDMVAEALKQLSREAAADVAQDYLRGNDMYEDGKDGDVLRSFVRHANSKNNT